MKKTLIMLACALGVTPSFAAINAVATDEGNALTLSNSYSASTTTQNISWGTTGSTSLDGGILTTNGDGYAYVKSTAVDGNGGYSFANFETKLAVTLSSVATDSNFHALLDVSTTNETGGASGGREAFAIGFVDGRWAIGTTSSWWSQGSSSTPLNFTSTIGSAVTEGSHALTIVCVATNNSTTITLKEGEMTLVSAIGNFGQTNALDTLYLGLGGTRHDTVYYTEEGSSRTAKTSQAVAATFVTPEPATATLSLLALAALASRRKRR